MMPKRSLASGSAPGREVLLSYAVLVLGQIIFSFEEEKLIVKKSMEG